MMGLYNFQARFVTKILAGEKTHTIRGVRANPDDPRAWDIAEAPLVEAAHA
jgi:hypothetical protein